MIELFPTSVLDTSILTAVLVGMLLVWFFQEWLGWGFTGLVVPGYLASVFLIQPLTGAVMVVEGVATWLVLVALSDALPRWWPWSPLFGRDRFFLALLASVGVRLAMEGALFPLLAERFQLRIAAELHSMGLVVVPLMAYAIWRNGPVRALPRLGVPLLITWLLLDRVLLQFTNLSLGSFELTYEDLALDFVSSPRAYILLLCGAWLGSVTNLRYGWDFGGIIVPGLLAICWLQPERLLATVCEGLIIAMVLRATLKLPALREMNLAGGRLLVLAMLVAYLLKFLLGHLLGAGWPGLRLRQLFGFGYLLPALIALRMVLSGDPFRTIVPALTTSLGGFVLGTSLAWGLAMTFPMQVEPAPPASGVSQPGSALQAAWAAQGLPPAPVEELLDEGAPRLTQGGDGLGAFWSRGGARPILITTRLGSGPLAQLAEGLAEELDAQAMLICQAQGPACERARKRLGRRLRVLELREGPVSRLSLAAGDEASLPPELLTARLPDLAVERDASRTVLELNPVDAWALAATLSGATPEPFRHPLRDRLESTSALLPAAPGLIRHELAAPLARWTRGGEDAEHALALATKTAQNLGLGLSRSEGLAAVQGPDWRILARQGGSPLILTVPWVEDEPHAASFALSLAVLWDASLVVLDSPRSPRSEESSLERAAHAGLLGGLEVLGPTSRVVTVSGLRDLHDVEADVVFSLGRPLLTGAVPPAWIRPRVDDLNGVGLSSGWYDGSPRRISLLDPQNPVRAAARAATGVEAQTTLFVGSQARTRAATLRPGGPAERVLSEAGVPAWELSATELAARARPQAPDPGWDSWLQAARGLSSPQGGAEAAASLLAEGRKQGAEVGILCEPLAGCRWAMALRCEGERCEAVVAGMNPTGPAPAEVPPLARLLLGDGVLVVDDLPRAWVRP